MADTFKIKVMKNGKPVEDVEVTLMVADGGKGKTNKEGKVTPAKKAGEPVLAFIRVKGDNLLQGGGPYEITPGVEFVLEI